MNDERENATVDSRRKIPKPNREEEKKLIDNDMTKKVNKNIFRPCEKMNGFQVNSRISTMNVKDWRLLD